MGQIGSKETIWLFIILILSRVTLDAVSVFVYNSGTAAAINSICGLIIATIAVLITNIAFKKNNSEDVFASVFGKRGQMLLGIILFIITILNASRRMTMFSDAIGDFVLETSPKAFILGIFAFSVFFASFMGIEPLTRFSYLAGIGIVLLIGIIAISSSVEVKLENIYPILGKGRALNVFNMLYVFSDIMYFYLIGRHVANRKKHIELGIVIKSGIIISFLAFFYTLCVPYPVSEKFVYPIYRLASLANTSVLIQRLDGFVFLIWLFSGFVSVGALTIFASEIFKSVFKLSDRRGALPVITFVIFLIALTCADKIKISDTILSIFAFAVFPVTSIIYKIKHRRRKNA